MQSRTEKESRKKRNATTNMVITLTTLKDSNPLASVLMQRSKERKRSISNDISDLTWADEYLTTTKRVKTHDSGDFDSILNQAFDSVESGFENEAHGMEAPASESSDFMAAKAFSDFLERETSLGALFAKDKEPSMEWKEWPDIPRCNTVSRVSSVDWMKDRADCSIEGLRIRDVFAGDKSKIDPLESFEPVEDDNLYSFLADLESRERLMTEQKKNPETLRTLTPTLIPVVESCKDLDLLTLPALDFVAPSATELEENKGDVAHPVVHSEMIDGDKEKPEKEFCVPTEVDVLLGRGGKSNNHPGNNRYRSEVYKLQDWYKTCIKTSKTNLSQCLVDWVHSYGGRFLALDSKTKTWFVVDNLRARKKCSQALRESKKDFVESKQALREDEKPQRLHKNRKKFHEAPS
jgi:hypothetical protein